MGIYIFLAISALTSTQSLSLSMGGTSTVPNHLPGSTVAVSAPAAAPLNLWITAYTSTPEETDDSPFITASGKRVRDGIVATNVLPFGTKVKIPELFGDKIFIVEDRMHKRKVHFMDVWMPTKAGAIQFGINYAKVVVLP